MTKMSLKSCAVCAQIAKTKRCAKCKNRIYCSVECQKTDWSVHKQYCGLSIEELSTRLELLVDNVLIKPDSVNNYKLCAPGKAFACIIKSFEELGKTPFVVETISKEVIKRMIPTEIYNNENLIILVVVLHHKTKPLIVVRTFVR